MQDVSTTITIDVEEFKKLLLDAHDSVRYCVELHNVRKENERLRKLLEGKSDVADS